MTTLSYSRVSVNSHQVNGLTPRAANMQYFFHFYLGRWNLSIAFDYFRGFYFGRGAVRCDGFDRFKHLRGVWSDLCQVCNRSMKVASVCKEIVLFRMYSVKLSSVGLPCFVYLFGFGGFVGRFFNLLTLNCWRHPLGESCRQRVWGWVCTVFFCWASEHCEVTISL